MSTSSVNWHERAAALHIDGRGLIDGQRCASLTGQTFDKHSPVDGRLLAPVMRGQQADVDAAVRSARAAFADRRWAGQAPAARKKVLQRWAEKVLAARDELALLETLDMGKPIRKSLNVDVVSSANCLAWYGEAVDKIYDEIAPTASTALALITREPMGVIGAIVPARPRSLHSAPMATPLPPLRYLSGDDVRAAMPPLAERLRLAERTMTAPSACFASLPVSIEIVRD